MGIATKLSVIDLADWSGERRDLGTFWRDRPIVLVFIRHFG
jgi:hypothetical protein